jgi:glycosyltransferase involved in cell wall biosynthesis
LENVLRQDYGNKEVLVIDGNSTDGTLDILNLFATKFDYFLSEPDEGIFDAMNKSLNHVTGDYVIFINAGDRFVNDHIISEIFDGYDGDDDLIYGDDYIQTNLGYKLRKANAIYTRNPTRRDLVFKSQGFCHQSLFTKIAILKKIKFNVNYSLGADYDTTAQIYFKGNHKIRYVDQPIAIFDDRNGGASHNQVEKIFKERILMFEYQPTFLDWLFVIKNIYISGIKKIIEHLFPNLSDKRRKRNYISKIVDEK